LRIRDVDPRSRIRFFSILDRGSRVKKIPGSRIRIRIKEFEHFNPTKFLKLSAMFIPDPNPGYGSSFFTHPGSRIQGQKGTASRIRNTAKIYQGLLKIYMW
jgi:hypothetical protein